MNPRVSGGCQGPAGLACPVTGASTVRGQGARETRPRVHRQRSAETEDTVMVHYIVQTAQGMLALLRVAESRVGSNSDAGWISQQLRRVISQSAILSNELERLDPRDFVPEARYEFVL